MNAGKNLETTLSLAEGTLDVLENLMEGDIKRAEFSRLVLIPQIKAFIEIVGIQQSKIDKLTDDLHKLKSTVENKRAGSEKHQR